MRKTLADRVKSPFTGGRVYVVEDVEQQEFRKEKYNVHTRYYVCEDTGEQFNTAEQGDLSLRELYGQYRIKHGIPFPDEIKNIRERYGLTQSQITRIMGFGQNQWRQYESGQVPSESNGKAIVAIKGKKAMLYMLEASKEEFSNTEYEKIRTKILTAQKEEDICRIYYYGQAQRSVYNGFSPMIPRKTAAMIQQLVHNEHSGVGKTKLNKEMFYADFLHYRRYGRSISGLQYRAIQMGPVAEHYDTLFDHTDNLQREEVVTDIKEFELLRCSEPQTGALDAQEKMTIEEVSAKLVPMKTYDVIMLAHKEPAWLKYKDRHLLIPYIEAFDLKAFGY